MMNMNNNNSIANSMRYQRAHFDETEDENGYSRNQPDPNPLHRHPLDEYEGGNGSPLTNDSVPDFTREPPPPLPPLSSLIGQTRAPTHVSYDPNDRWNEPSVIRPKDYSVLNHDQQRNPYETPRLSSGGQSGLNGGLGSGLQAKRWSTGTGSKLRPTTLATKMPFPNSLFRIPLNYWNRRSRAERLLISLLGLSLFTVMVLSILVRKHNQMLMSSALDETTPWGQALLILNSFTAYRTFNSQPSTGGRAEANITKYLKNLYGGKQLVDIPNNLEAWSIAAKNQSDLLTLAESVLNQIDPTWEINKEYNETAPRPPTILIFINTLLGSTLDALNSSQYFSKKELQNVNDQVLDDISLIPKLGGTDGSNFTKDGSNNQKPLNSDVCLTPYCISISAKLLNSMNTTADPCHDFYEYSCGGWVRDNNIPDGQSSWNNFQALFQKNQYILKRILEKEDSAFETKAELKAKIYYDSCLDENDTIEALGAKPLLTLLNRYGGWNMSELKVGLKQDKLESILNVTSAEGPEKVLAQTEKNEKIMNRLLPPDWDFLDRMERLSIDLDISLLFSIYVSDDDKNSSQNALYIDMGRTSLPKRDYYLNTSVPENGEIYRAYLKYMTAVGVLLSSKIDQSARVRTLRAIRDPDSKGPILKKVNQSAVVTPKPPSLSTDYYSEDDPEFQFLALVKTTMSNVLEFETRMANFTPPPETLRDGEKNYNKMSLRELDEKYNCLNWTRYLNRLFNLVNITLKPDQPIVVRSIEYMANMTELIKEYLATAEKRTIMNNYFMWHVTSRMIPYLSQDFRATLRPLSKALKGSAEGLVPWRACISDTNNIIGFPLGSMFVKETFQGHNKEMAEKMINRIKEAFKNQLPTLDWMDEETIKVASEKADAIRNKIGFPEYLLNPKEMNEKFEGLEFEKDEYFENNLRQLKFYMIKGLERLIEPVDKTRWSLTPPMVNAYYLATGNEMVFPAGILQPPFYDSNFPKALNFGAMGFVVGHELTHGFDDQGRQFDKFGNLKSWWNNASIARFNDRAECLEKQYSNYKIEQITINGKQTIGENIADNGGLKATFSAFQAFLAANPEAASRLPGLNMTDNQLFFLAFSQVWCSLDTKKSLYYEILNDSHSPNKIRVIGTLANSVEFSKAFDCPLKSPMNPADKCVVW